MDLWKGAYELVVQRLSDSRQLLTDIPAIHYETAPPVRTDGGMEAAPFIQVTERYAEPDGPTHEPGRDVRVLASPIRPALPGL